MSAARTAAEAEAYAAGLRAGYGHGYDVGVAHGRAEAFREPGDGAATGSRDWDRPGRDQLIARGYIPRDHTRPPALPARLWDASDWAKADSRDLPTTDYGRAQWRAAVAAGRVPAELAEAFAARECSAAEVTESITAAVADSGRRVADLRARVTAAQERHTELEGERGAARRNGLALEDAAAAAELEPACAREDAR